MTEIDNILDMVRDNSTEEEYRQILAMVQENIDHRLCALDDTSNDEES